MQWVSLRGVAAEILALHLCLTGLTGAREVFADQPPPEAKMERIPGPRDGYFWGQGHWAWSGKSWFWVSGSWVVQRRGMNWVPDHWEPEDERWHFVPAHWDHG